MKFLVVDDHALIREALRGVLTGAAGRCRRAGGGELSAGDGVHPAACAISRWCCSICICPIATASMSLAELRERYPAISVVMLSAFNDRDNVVQGPRRVARSASSRRPPRARSCSARCGSFWPAASIFHRTFWPRRRRLRRCPADSRLPHGRPSPAELGLTERQVEVLALMMQGKSNKLICRALDLAEPTVKNHVSAILKALEVSNRTEAVLAVAALGWELPKIRRLTAPDSNAVGRTPGSAQTSLRRGIRPAEPGHHGAQRHGVHRLVQQVMAARLCLSQPLRRDVAADEKCRDRSVERRDAAAVMASMPVRPSFRRKSEMIRFGACAVEAGKRLVIGLGGHDAAAPALEQPAGAIQHQRVVVDHHDELAAQRVGRPSSAQSGRLARVFDARPHHRHGHVRSASPYPDWRRGRSGDPSRAHRRSTIARPSPRPSPRSRSVAATAVELAEDVALLILGNADAAVAHLDAQPPGDAPAADDDRRRSTCSGPRWRRG